MASDLEARGFNKLQPWTRGVDIDHFNPGKRGELDFPRPIFLCVGRVAVEKNLPAFLDLDLPGSKVIVGEGPEFDRLKAKYPDAHFLGHGPATNWRASTPRRTYSSSRAAPTRSAT